MTYLNRIVTFRTWSYRRAARPTFITPEDPTEYIEVYNNEYKIALRIDISNECLCGNIAKKIDRAEQAFKEKITQMVKVLERIQVYEILKAMHEIFYNYPDKIKMGKKRKIVEFFMYLFKHDVDVKVNNSTFKINFTEEEVDEEHEFIQQLKFNLIHNEIHGDFTHHDIKIEYPQLMEQNKRLIQSLHKSVLRYSRFVTEVIEHIIKE